MASAKNSKKPATPNSAPATKKPKATRACRRSPASCPATSPPATPITGWSRARRRTDQRTGRLRIRLLHRQPELDQTLGRKARGITVTSNDTLTVSGGDYFCSISLSGNSQLIMGASAQVRFFFDTPEHCGLSAGATQLSFTGNTRIASTSKTVFPAFYFLGSPTMESIVRLAATPAPKTNWSSTGPTDDRRRRQRDLQGRDRRKKIKVSGDGRVENDISYKPPVEITPVTESSVPKEKEKTEGKPKETKVTTARYYSPQFYVECTGTAPRAALRTPTASALSNAQPSSCAPGPVEFDRRTYERGAQRQPHCRLALSACCAHRRPPGDHLDGRQRRRRRIRNERLLSSHTAPPARHTEDARRPLDGPGDGASLGVRRSRPSAAGTGEVGLERGQDRRPILSSTTGASTTGWSRQPRGASKPCRRPPPSSCPPLRSPAMPPQSRRRCAALGREPRPGAGRDPAPKRVHQTIPSASGELRLPERRERRAGGDRRRLSGPDPSHTSMSPSSEGSVTAWTQRNPPAPASPSPGCRRLRAAPAWMRRPGARRGLTPPRSPGPCRHLCSLPTSWSSSATSPRTGHEAGDRGGAQRRSPPSAFFWNGARRRRRPIATGSCPAMRLDHVDLAVYQMEHGRRRPDLGAPRGAPLPPGAAHRLRRRHGDPDRGDVGPDETLLAVDDIQIATALDCRVVATAQEDIEALIGRLNTLQSAVTEAVSEGEEEDELARGVERD